MKFWRCQRRAILAVKVLIRGVVTAAQPDADWSGRFFVQDATAGIFVENVSTNQQPLPGDLVEIAGVTPGGFAPIITQPRWHKLGTAPLPEAKAVPIEQLMAGIEDSQRVEISGIVRAFRLRGGDHFEIASGGYRLDVNVPPPAGWIRKPSSGAQVRIRGTAATFFSGKLRHLITVTLHVPRAEDFVIEKTEPGDPFAARVIPWIVWRNIGASMSSASAFTSGRRHVSTAWEDVFLQDATGACRSKAICSKRLRPGDVVEAVGFPNFEQFLPVLQDAVFRPTTAPRQQPTTKAVSIPELQGRVSPRRSGDHPGRVLDRMERWVQPARGGRSAQRTILTLQYSNFLFSVEVRSWAVTVKNFRLHWQSRGSQRRLSHEDCGRRKTPIAADPAT